MKTALFNFELPESLIAEKPVSPRDSARMLVVNDATLKDSHVFSLPDYVKQGDVMVFNNTKVIPARLIGKRGEVKIEIMLHKLLQDSEWRVFAKPAKRLKIQDIIQFGADFSATVMQKRDNGEVTLKFQTDNFYQMIEKYGKIPLPPYIKRDSAFHDSENYQTIYAKREGAVAAPTAGLHFTEELLNNLKNKRIKTAYVTLHVGAGTFQPVKTQNTEEHIMHSEYAEISPLDANTINEARKTGGRVIAVGTTSLRVLESAADMQGNLQAFSGETDIFITPGYQFKCVDILMTNFHLPQSTLFMLVSALCGLDTMQKAYEHAISANYRFYSYGDACLLFSHKNFP